VVNKVLNLIGLAYRSRNVVLSDTALEAVTNKKAKLVFIANDASDKSIKKYTDKCKYYDIDYNLDFNTLELSSAVGSFNRKLIAVLDQGFSKKMLEEIERRVINGI